MPRQLLGSRISTYMRLREGASLYDPGVTGGPSKISSPRPLSGLSGPIRRVIACASRSRALIHFLVSPFIRRQQKERSTASPPPIRHTLRDILIIQKWYSGLGCRGLPPVWLLDPAVLPQPHVLSRPDCVPTHRLPRSQRAIGPQMSTMT